jgi:hypothetical protein
MCLLGANNWKTNNYNNTTQWRRPNIPNLADPNAMDLSPGRVVWLKQKIMTREETAIKQGQEDKGPLHQQDKGKSSNVSIVTNQVTLKEIVDSP